MDGSWHVWTVPADGGAPPRRLTSTDAGEIYPRYTPDGKFLTYHNWSAPRRIWRVPADGGMPQLVSRSPDGESYADVSPDGRWIAFTRTEAQGERVYVAPIDGGSASDRSAVIRGSNGSAVIRGSDGSAVIRGSDGSAVIRGPERLLTTSLASVPRWSPDGRRIAFSPNRSFADGVLVIEADGTRERRVSAQGGWPVWWPHGRRIGFLVQAPDGTQEIHVVPAQGGAASELASVRFRSSNHPFDVSRDGRWLVTSNTMHQSDEIWLLKPR